MAVAGRGGQGPQKCQNRLGSFTLTWVMLPHGVLHLVSPGVYGLGLRDWAHRYSLTWLALSLGVPHLASASCVLPLKLRGRVPLTPPDLTLVPPYLEAALGWGPPFLTLVPEGLPSGWTGRGAMCAGASNLPRTEGQRRPR